MTSQASTLMWCQEWLLSGDNGRIHTVFSLNLVNPKGIAAGADAYIMKPFKWKHIITLVLKNPQIKFHYEKATHLFPVALYEPY